MNRRFAAALLPALILSACGPFPTAPSVRSTPRAATPSASAAVSEPTAGPTAIPQSRIEVPPDELKGLTLSIAHAWFGPAADLLQKQADEFNATNEWGITVSLRPFPTYGDMTESIGTTLSGTNQPDVVIALPEQLLVWNEQRGVVDLTPYVADPRWGFSQAEIADFPAPFWEQDVSGELRLGLPSARSASLLLYNRTWARELGFSTPPATARAFEQQACAAHQSFLKDAAENNDGFGGWMVDSAPETAVGWLYAFGGGVVTPEGDYQFRTGPNQEALEFLKGMFDEKCAWVSGEASPYDQFTGRRALFATTDLGGLSEQLRSFRLAAATDEWTVLAFPGPTAGRGGLVVYGPSFAVLQSGGARQLGAWLFVRWMLSTENQAGWAETTGLFPLRASSLAAMEAYRGSHPQWAAAVALLPDARGVPELASWRIVKHVVGDGFGSLFRQNIPVDRVNVLLTQMDQTASALANKP